MKADLEAATLGLASVVSSSCIIFSSSLIFFQSIVEKLDEVKQLQISHLVEVENQVLVVQQ